MGGGAADTEGAPPLSLDAATLVGWDDFTARCIEATGDDEPRRVVIELHPSATRLDLGAPPQPDSLFQRAKGNDLVARAGHGSARYRMLDERWMR
jgi:hypothetical protein